MHRILLILMQVESLDLMSLHSVDVALILFSVDIYIEIFFQVLIFALLFLLVPVTYTFRLMPLQNLQTLFVHELILL